MVTRLFISYDYDNDSTLKEFLVGQSKLPDSPFVFADASVKAHLTGDWKDKVKGRIKNADQVAVICGKNTDTATGVAAEVTIAQEVGRPHFLLKGDSDGGNKKPSTAKSSDAMHDWTWSNLKSLIV